MTGVPSARRAAANVLFPLAIPPVRPMSRMNLVLRRGRRGGGRLPGLRVGLAPALGLRDRFGLEAHSVDESVLAEEDGHPARLEEPDHPEVVGERLLRGPPVGSLDRLAIELVRRE